MLQPLLTLGLTIVLEYLVYLVLLRQEKWHFLLLVSVLVNALTQPLASYFYRYIFPEFWLIEAGVWLAETFLLALLLGLRLNRALLLSFVANAFSAFCGLLIFQWWA